MNETRTKKVMADKAVLAHALVILGTGIEDAKTTAMEAVELELDGWRLHVGIHTDLEGVKTSAVSGMTYDTYRMYREQFGRDAVTYASLHEEAKRLNKLAEAKLTARKWRNVIEDMGMEEALSDIEYFAQKDDFTSAAELAATLAWLPMQSEQPGISVRAPEAPKML